MHITPNTDRLKLLDVSNFQLGDTVLFCPKCTWQAEQPHIAMKNECPVCYSSLHVSKIDDDLVELIRE